MFSNTNHFHDRVGSEELRNQFVSNANPHHAKDNLRGNSSYVTDEDESSFVFGNDTTNLAPYPPSKGYSGISKNIETSNANTYEYELDRLQSSYSINNNSAENPFDSSQASYPYNSYGQSSKENPFRDQSVPEFPQQEYNPFEPHREQPPIPVDDEYEKMRKNEKARLRQLRRKPRFHYTKLPYFTILVTLIQVSVFIAELAKMSSLTGSAFQTKPYFNPMLGPSTYLMINMGARYAPCMQSIKGITNDTTINFPCPNSTTTDTNVCSLNELCGLSGVPIKDDVYKPHQWYRVITPMFLHAGFLHILFNLLLQVTMGASIERSIGFIKYAIIYLMCGISGFLLGANFSPNGIASTGASGALFGVVATNIIMFVYCGKKNTNIYGTKKYGLFIFIMIMEIVISLVLGLLPGMDNFSHIGGFAMGILMAILLLPDPFLVYVDGIITYHARDDTMQQFRNNWNPIYNWEDKIPSRFYIWCGIRVVSLVLAIVYIALLVKNFFNGGENPIDNNCSWCKYINCLPVNGWCDIGEVTVETEDSSNSKRTINPEMLFSETKMKNLEVLGTSQNLIQGKNSQISAGGSFFEYQNSSTGVLFCCLLGLMTLKFYKSKKRI